jgi:hypothetical protein
MSLLFDPIYIGAAKVRSKPGDSNHIRHSLGFFVAMNKALPAAKTFPCSSSSTARTHTFLPDFSITQPLAKITQGVLTGAL